jgi:hypothetical protein
VSTATIVVCPPLPGADSELDAAQVVDAVLDDPRASGIAALSPYVPAGEPRDDARTLRAHWVGHLSIALSTGSVTAPVLLVLTGASGAVAPALGFSQKASRRAVSGYVLIDATTPALDSGGDDWPDAPVTYVASPAADPLEVNQARLRGWTVREIPDLDAATVADAIVTALG